VLYHLHVFNHLRGFRVGQILGFLQTNPVLSTDASLHFLDVFEYIGVNYVAEFFYELVVVVSFNGDIQMEIAVSNVPIACYQNHGFLIRREVWGGIYNTLHIFNYFIIVLSPQ